MNTILTDKHNKPKHKHADLDAATRTELNERLKALASLPPQTAEQQTVIQHVQQLAATSAPREELQERLVALAKTQPLTPEQAAAIKEVQRLAARQ